MQNKQVPTKSFQRAKIMKTARRIPEPRLPALPNHYASSMRLTMQKVELVREKIPTKCCIVTRPHKYWAWVSKVFEVDIEPYDSGRRNQGKWSIAPGSAKLAPLLSLCPSLACMYWKRSSKYMLCSPGAMPICSLCWGFRWFKAFGTKSSCSFCELG